MTLRILVADSALAAVALAAALPAMSMAIDNLPMEKRQGDVAYLTGGVGSDEARAMREAEHRYPLSLEFVKKARARDEFLAGVKVTIEDRHGTPALAATSQGPFLLAKLPEGRYTVRAEDRGRTKIRNVTISGHDHRHLVFVW